MLPEQAMPDRRHDVRKVVNAELRLLAELGGSFVHDISRGGVFVRTDNPLPQGTRVTLHCTVVQDELELLQGVGMVVRVVNPPSPPSSLRGMGIAFVELEPGSRELVERILVRR